jgi:hypothetical protein
MTHRIVIAIVVITSFLASCSPRVLRPGEQRVIETSGHKHSWVASEEPTFHEDNTWFFRGQAMDVADLPLGLRQAEADAKKRIISKIAEQVATEYSEYAIGAGASDGDKSLFVSDGISWATEGITVVGVAPVKSYWERVERGPSRTQAYEIYVLVALSDADYTQAQERAVRAIEQRARAKADRRAEEAAQRLRQRLELEKRQ